jgi:hypothetical protein
VLGSTAALIRNQRRKSSNKSVDHYVSPGADAG